MCSASNRVWFVNRVFHPSEAATAQVLEDLAFPLAAAGINIGILTSRLSADAPANETINGVRIRRIGQPVAAIRKGLIGKLVQYFQFSAQATAQMRMLATAPDRRFVVMTDPPLLAPLMMLRAPELLPRTIHWIQDIHPEIGLSLAPGMLHRAAVQPLRTLRDRAWKKASACVTLGQDMADFIASRGVPKENLSICANWAPEVGLRPVHPGRNPLRADWGLMDKFIVAYSGNLGRVHEFETLLDTAERLLAITDIRFLIIGDGPKRRQVEAAVSARRLGNVAFQPLQPKNHIADSLALPDLHLVTLQPGCERYVFPSKLYGPLAVGRPVAFIGAKASEIAGMITSQKMGWTFAPGQSGLLAQLIWELSLQPYKLTSAANEAYLWHRAHGGVRHAVAFWQNLLSVPPRTS